MSPAGKQPPPGREDRHDHQRAPEIGQRVEEEQHAGRRRDRTIRRATPGARRARRRSRSSGTSAMPARSSVRGSASASARAHALAACRTTIRSCRARRSRGTGRTAPTPAGRSRNSLRSVSLDVRRQRPRRRTRTDRRARCESRRSDRRHDERDDDRDCTQPRGEPAAHRSALGRREPDAIAIDALVGRDRPIGEIGPPLVGAHRRDRDAPIHAVVRA